ncbi:RagB/SusD family nutrient uptake outer membrane protein [Chitinophaga eiseniae]|uniref:RagB/SusD family nutrient uptake outer membrane protein n=1 Tax=Chitinophaga eiseniae TaxID=634771 RepID=A0A847SXR9_9BACT|nr:RagB/SusD family nutrient uptake outer membrane protein [Chitinophaga eiseniae]NLR82472.1 RagB/SusD family nutrient uptake outer membrane protein [Chitinophaga eiseniae]
MMRKLLYYGLMLLCITTISCKKYLDVVPKEVVTEKDIYDNINTAERAWANMYTSLSTSSTNIYTNTTLAACTDECKNHWENVPELKFNSGAWGPTDNSLDNWGTAWQFIRRANIFLKNIDKTPIPQDRADYYSTRIPQYKAEVRFLRAKLYFELLRAYGAVPLLGDDVTDVSAKVPDELNIRKPIDNVVNYIVTELDQVAPILPIDYTDNPGETGRITRGGAMALKAITLLYAASPLLNGNTMYAGIKNTDGTQLFPQAYDKEKWKKAADAAKAVLDMNVYALNNPNPANPIDNYARLFFSREYKETILPLLLGSTRDLDQNVQPNGQDAQSAGGYGKFSVLQEMVDAYEMKNGLPITDPGSGYTKDGFWNGPLWDGKTFRQAANISNMYKDRDPRFYASINFQYALWDSANHRRPLRYAYFGNNGGASDGWPKSGTNCETGYNMRKWCDPGVNLRGAGNGNRNFPIIRLAEIYLIYAEAMNEYLDAPSQDVYDAINKVRARVSMPALPVNGTNDNTKVGMRKRIQNEWRVEFAFEGKRFWNVRRWLIAKNVDNGSVHGMNARPTSAELQATGLDPNSEAAGVAVFYKLTTIQTRVFMDRHYLMPIPQSEIDKGGGKLVQNLGW